VYVPAVIITRISAEPNPRRVPLSPLPTQPSPVQAAELIPSLSSHGKQSSRPDISMRLAARQIGREAEKTSFFL